MHLELVGERFELQELSGLRVARQQPRGRAQEREIHLDLLDDAGSSHLDDDCPAALHERPVRLRDRGRRERLGIDAREDVRTEIGLDHGVDLGERHRRHLVDEAAELLDVHVGQEVRPRGEELAQLDEGRAELLQRAPESFRTLTCRVSVTDDADLREHPAESGTAGDPGDGQRPASPLHACAHVERDDPVDRGGNAEKPQTSWP